MANGDQGVLQIHDLIWVSKPKLVGYAAFLITVKVSFFHLAIPLDLRYNRDFSMLETGGASRMSGFPFRFWDPSPCSQDGTSV